jgi:hypothetical protein
VEGFTVGERVDSDHLPLEITIEGTNHEEKGKGGAREEQKKVTILAPTEPTHHPQNGHRPDILDIAIIKNITTNQNHNIEVIAELSSEHYTQSQSHWETNKPRQTTKSK